MPSPSYYERMREWPWRPRRWRQYGRRAKRLLRLRRAQHAAGRGRGQRPVMPLTLAQFVEAKGRDFLFVASPGFGRPMPYEVIAAVAREYRIHPAQIRSADKAYHVTAARWAAIRALTKQYPEASPGQIGRWVNRDRTTILHVLGRKLRRHGLEAA